MPDAAPKSPNVFWMPVVMVALLAGIAMAVYNNGSAAATADAEQSIAATWAAIDAEPAEVCHRATSDFFGWTGAESEFDRAETRERCAAETTQLFGEGETLGVLGVEVLALDTGITSGDEGPPAFVAVQVDSEKIVEGTEFEFVYLAVPMREVDGEWLVAGQMTPFRTIEEIRAALNLRSPSGA